MPDTTPSQPLVDGQAANLLASENVFTDYRQRKAARTLTRQDDDLAAFNRYLESLNSPVGGGDLTQPKAWLGVTWGLIAGFARWMLNQGYAMGTINLRLSTLKTYARLALSAGALATTEYAQIRAISGYPHHEAVRVDDSRRAASTPTRRGSKKAAPTPISPHQAAALKSQPDTPQGRRDALLLCLLLDHGLRVGEAARLAVTDFDLQAGVLRFFRPKVTKTQVHRLTQAALQAARAYFAQDAPSAGAVFRSSLRGGGLGDGGMRERAINRRVGVLGARVGLDGLSPHDCRHFWATQAARNGTQIDRLQDAGGWASPYMPLRYVEAAKVANDGVKLGD